MTFLVLALFEDEYSAVVERAREMDNMYVVGSNHVPLLQILSDPMFKALMLIIWRISQLGITCKGRKALTYERISGLFNAFGHGDIKRFRSSDMEDHFNNSKLSEFLIETTVFLIRSKQNACARCYVVSLDEQFGAFDFESDHVDENFRKKGEEKEKDFELICSKSCNILKLLNEVAKTQVRCVFAMLFVLFFLYVNRCLLCPRQPSLPASVATLR
jgi:hypothetical protein